MISAMIALAGSCLFAAFPKHDVQIDLKNVIPDGVLTIAVAVVGVVGDIDNAGIVTKVESDRGLWDFETDAYHPGEVGSVIR